MLSPCRPTSSPCVLSQARIDKARYQEALNRYQQRLAAEGAEQGAAEESTEQKTLTGDTTPSQHMHI